MTSVAIIKDPRVTSALLTTALCIGIAWLLSIVGAGTDFWDNLTVSFCIGYSIFGVSLLGLPLIANRVPPLVGEIIAVAIGLSLGLILGGWLVTGSPAFFFVEDTGTVLIGIFFGVLGTVVFSSLHRVSDLKNQLEHIELSRTRQEKQLLATELKLLQAQIEPHFLFNTLSNVVGLIRRDPDSATRTLQHLTTLLRATLIRTRNTLVTLADEMELVRAYLEIQRIRMGERLRYDIRGVDEFNQQPLPPLLLQPLVENAVRHGIEPAESGGRIVISATRAGHHLLLTVADDGLGLHTDDTGSQTGLRNIRERLRGLYGDAATLRVSENQPHGFIATIQIPLTGIA
ncbi:MAG: histidine kinase [Gammaproteobacteria bacterium]|nr:histidine kinase [Gammaproteobacteria bacterium]